MTDQTIRHRSIIVVRYWHQPESYIIYSHDKIFTLDTYRHHIFKQDGKEKHFEPLSHAYANLQRMGFNFTDYQIWIRHDDGILVCVDDTDWMMFVLSL